MEESPLLAGILGGLAVASLFIWLFWLAPRLRAQTELIPYEPREPVPWDGWDLGIVMASLLFVLSCAIEAFAVLGDHGGPSGDGEKMLADSVGKAVGCCVAIAYLRLHRKATWLDLGIDFRKLKSDVPLGFVAFLAACLPVYGLMFLLTQLVDYNHPMIKTLKDQPEVSILLFATWSAVIVAPIAEELFFRVLLQGWFESLERHWHDARSPGLPVKPSILPILASSFLFSLAHVGNGPDQIPLFLFGLFLGYLYRQTHRLAPSVVTHLCLNATSIAQLWFVTAGHGAS